MYWGGGVRFCRIVILACLLLILSFCDVQCVQAANTVSYSGLLTAWDGSDYVLDYNKVSVANCTISSNDSRWKKGTGTYQGKRNPDVYYDYYFGPGDYTIHSSVDVRFPNCAWSKNVICTNFREMSVYDQDNLLGLSRQHMRGMDKEGPTFVPDGFETEKPSATVDLQQTADHDMNDTMDKCLFFF